MQGPRVEERAADPAALHVLPVSGSVPRDFYKAERAFSISF